jgi:hypothetical protein
MDKLEETKDKTKEIAPGAVGGFPLVPTTKILAIGRFLAPLTPEQRKATLPREVPETVRLFVCIWEVRSTNGGIAKMGKAPSFS